MSNKTRSKAEYVLDVQDKNAIIYVTSYHRRDYDLATIRFNPADYQSVCESLLRPFLNPPYVSLRDLDQIPLELLSKIYLTLNV
jgi:hypothetical protein